MGLVVCMVRFLLIFFFVFLSVGFKPALMSAQLEVGPPTETPLLEEEKSGTDRLDDLREHWLLLGLRGAREQGFLSIAATYAGQLVELSRKESVREEAFNTRVQFDLLRGRPEEASSVIEKMRMDGLEPDPLLEAFLAFESGRLEESRRALAVFDPEELREGWIPILRALVAAAQGDPSLANRFFTKALEAASSPALRSYFELLRMRVELTRTEEASEDTISALRDTYRSMKGERAGFEAARLLAIALYRNGQQDAAIQVLVDNLSAAGLREFGLRGDFLFLLGRYAGPESNRGRLALRELVSDGRDVRQQRLALTMLVRSLPEAEKNGFLAILEDWLSQSPPHPLQDQMLAYDAYLRLRSGRPSAAAESARLLLERFPESSMAKEALRLLAFISYQEQPPRYRTAADYLGRLQERLEEPIERQRTGALIGDCFFLNGDYASAAEAYAAVYPAAPPELAESLFFQRIVTHLRARKLEEAASLMDRLRSDPRLRGEVVWKAEWNLLETLRRENAEAAFSRLEELLRGKENPFAEISPELRLRLRWLRARLFLGESDPQLALEQIRELEDDLTKSPFTELDGELLLAVRRYLLLMRGEAHFRAENPAEGRRSFTELRTEFPGSGPAVLSYLVESRSASNEDNLVNAQQSLIDLVDRFPESRYAPIALWEAALKAEQRGLATSLQEAVNLLERLVTTYPEHELVFLARLKQGDLARRLNDFPTALILYENLLQEFSDHPDRYRAELSLGDCLLALGGEDPARYDEAALLYERNTLLPTVPLPARIEAGYKWARSLRQQGDRKEAKAVLFLLLERFVENAPSRDTLLLAENGRYWMARALLDLAGALSEGDRPGKATAIYEKVIALKLPGSALARARTAELDLTSNSSAQP